MTLMNWKGIAQAVASCAAIVIHCTGPMQAGSETTSGVEIAAKDAAICGRTTPSATVMIFDARYNPGDTQRVADSVSADDSGFFTFTDLPSGSYNIFVYGKTALAKGAAVLGIPVVSKPDGRYEDSATFASLLTITGKVTYEDQPDSLSQVYIIGSPFCSETDSHGGFSFVDVPEGIYVVVARSSSWRTPVPAADSAVVDLSSAKNAITNVTFKLH